MRSKEYWEGRFIDLQRSQLKRADSFAHELEDLHARMQKEIEDDITVWHKKVATANGISMADAKKLMSRKDRKEFQWTLEEYEQHAKADLLSGVTSANVMNASANWHLSYLDGMKLQLEHHVDKLYKNIDSKTRNHFKESLNENYLNTAFELQKGIGIGEKMEIPYDERKLENILRTPWASDGKNFSQRIWKDRTQLVNNLQKNLSESVIRGEADTEMIQALSKDEDRAEFNTRRLVETESAYFDSLSEQQCCEDFGIEKYRFLAVLDMKTSDICQELDNKVFLEKDRQVGVNAPPMHPFCRSTTAPVIDEEFLTSRRAKNPKTGEYDEIPPEMNYKQWKEKYVEGKDNAEEVKQEQVQVPKETERGYKLEVPAENIKASEGETVHKDTAVPPKEQEEKFDSEAFKENYDNRVINKSAVQEPATIELDNPVSYGNTEEVYGPIKLQEKQEEVIKQQTKQNERLNEITKDNINRNFPYISKNNILLEGFNDNIVKSVNSAFSNLKNIEQDIYIKTGKHIEFSTIKVIGAGKDFYNIVKNNFWRQNEQELKNLYYKKIGRNAPQIYIQQKLQERENKLKEQCGLVVGKGPIAFNAYEGYYCIDKNHVGIFINPNNIKGNYNSTEEAKKNKFHPPNCYTYQATVSHEAGHAIDELLDLHSNETIINLYNQDKERYDKFKEKRDSLGDPEISLKECKKQFGENFDFLSELSFKLHDERLEKINAGEMEEHWLYHEFIAEAISEILVVGYENARKTAQDVWVEVLNVIKDNKNNNPSIR